MWKYKCKSQLITLSISFAVGVVLSYFAFSNDLLLSSGILNAEAIAFIQANPVMMYLIGGLSIAGLVNVILVIQLITSQFNINPFIVFLCLMMFPNVIMVFGTILVIPMFILSIYGVVSLKTSYNHQMKARNLSNDEEIVRIYTIHHKLDEEYRSMAIQCRKNVDKATLIYMLGIFALFAVMILVDNLVVIMISMIFYMMAFNYLLRYRASSFTPITQLMYEKCDPEACASAIIYYSTRGKRVKLKQQALLAQCLIYMNDPQLAQDVLISYPKKDSNSALNYWTLMAYSSYLLKDEDALIRAKDEASQIKKRFSRSGVFFRSEEVASIENKIHLMNGDFSTCKKFFLNSLKTAIFPFQQVDASYYIALISFVEEDYTLAKMYFEKVVQLGNKIYFVENAKNYLFKIEQIDLENVSE